MMISRFRIAGTALVLLGAAVGAQAQITKGAKGYTFRVKYEVGKTVSNQMVAATKFGASTFNMEIPVKIKCTSAKGDTFNIETTSGPTKMNGKAMGATKPEVAKMQINNRGEILSGAKGGMQGLDFSSTRLPQAPINIGQTWDGDVNMPQAGGSNVKAKYKFARITKINGKECAQIEVTMSMTGMASMSGKGVLNLLTTNGQPLSMELKLSGKAPTGAGSGSAANAAMSTTVTMKRL